MKRIVLGVAVGCLMGVASARDLGQWEATDSEIVAWYRNLKMPDAPTVSCCGEADAYWADSFEVQDGKYVALKDTIKGFKEILEGKHDGKSEQAFYMKGTIDQVKDEKEAAAAAKSKKW